MLPRNRSQTARSFATSAFGAPCHVRSISIPVPSAIRANLSPYLLSLSRIRYRGPSPNGVASRSCWATQAPVGFLVTPKCARRREPTSRITNKDRPEGDRGSGGNLRTRSHLHGFAGRLHTSAWLSPVYALHGYTSEWYSSQPLGQPQAVHRGSAQRPRCGYPAPCV